MSIQEFNGLIVNNSEGLRPFALSLTRDGEEAEDLFQETLYKALAHRDKFEPGTNVKAWLCTIMRNIFINEYRRNDRKKALFDTLQYAERGGTQPFSSERTLRLAEINGAIYGLPFIFKNVCLLYLQGYKYGEIAAALDEPLGTVKSRIHFARKMLQKKLER